MSSPIRRWSTRGAALVVAAAAGVTAVVTTIVASDHQDTAMVELNPTRDINDVYIFPAAESGRVVLAITTQSPVTPAETPRARFDPNVLYQIKIDNNGDGVEDRVFQMTFRNDNTGKQIMSVRGPVAPPQTGTISMLANVEPAIRGPINTILGTANGIQAFAGIRADPFFIDLEQFFRIIPDRRPVSGPLSQIPDVPSATSFRNPGINFLTGINAMAIVLELPKAMLGASPGGAVGVWATTSIAATGAGSQ